MNLTSKLKTISLAVLAVIVFFLVIIFLGTKGYKSPRQFPLVQLEEGWTVSSGDNVYHPEVLSSCKIGLVNKEDVLVLTKTLPDYILSPATIHFRTILSSTVVYLDDEIIYSFGDDYVARNLMLPKYQHFVFLPDDFAGKTLRIEITAHENNAFSGISPVTIGNHEEISRNMVQNNRLPLAIGVFLVVFGQVLIILSPYLIFTAQHDYSIAFSGFISVFLGLYILSFNDLFWLFSDQPSFYTFIEYFSLFAIPAAILGFLTGAHQIYNPIIGIILWIVNLGFSLITALLHILNFVHICHFVQVLHFLGLIEGVYIIISLTLIMIKRNKANGYFFSNNASASMLILGLILFLTCSVVDIIKFNILKFISAGEVNTSINFMTVGALMFMICLVLNYFFHCTESINEATLKQELEGLAYTDSLTGLFNRSKCEVALTELKNDYTIISIDLDYLKYTNDNYGHASGDKLLGGFADILRNSFTDATLIGRMGGDEFIVILPYIDKDRIERDLACFVDLMDYRSSLDKPIKYSASYGTANNRDVEGGVPMTPQNVYLLADTRMYQMKNQHHQDSFGRLYDDLLKHLGEKGGMTNE